MAAHRIEKINGQIQRELSLIIQQKMKDSRLNRNTLSITSVKATTDLKTATIYVSIFGTTEEKEEILGLLDNAKGFLRSNLGKVLKVHSIPALTFELDDSVEYGMHIDSILAGLKKDKGKVEKDEESTCEDS
ncbi:MAG: 30S ribosome-binding factor RbfA [Eubacterium sp.]